MKRSEIAMIILIASLSMIFTFTLAQSLLGDKIKRQASVEQAAAVSDQLEQPSKRTFNSTAINPTIEVCVQNSNDDQTASETCNASPVDDTTSTTDNAAQSGQPAPQSAPTNQSNN